MNLACLLDMCRRCSVAELTSEFGAWNARLSREREWRSTGVYAQFSIRSTGMLRFSSFKMCSDCQAPRQSFVAHSRLELARTRLPLLDWPHIQALDITCGLARFPCAGVNSR